MEPPYKDRIVDVSGLGFELPIPGPFQVKAGGTFTSDLTQQQADLLQQMASRRSAVEHHTWMNGIWTAMEAFRLKYPVPLPEQDAEGMYRQVQIRYFP